MDSNHRPVAYKTTALTAELCAHVQILLLLSRANLRLPASASAAFLLFPKNAYSVASLLPYLIFEGPGNPGSQHYFWRLIFFTRALTVPIPPEKIKH